MRRGAQIAQSSLSANEEGLSPVTWGNQNRSWGGGSDRELLTGKALEFLLIRIDQ